MTPQPDDLVLVALLNNQPDLARARDEHWYRIPVSSADKWLKDITGSQEDADKYDSTNPNFLKK